MEKTQLATLNQYKTDHYDQTTIFEVPVSEIVSVVRELYCVKHLPLKLITATDERKESNCFKIWYVFGVPQEQSFLVAFVRLQDSEEFPSVTRMVHEAWNHERKIQTFFGLTPVDHPDPRPILLHENWPANVFPLRKDFDWQTRPQPANGTYQFQKVQGEGIYEIPVGPIHAGIIEPGHFRFSVAGEEIMLLEARLGFTHKGSEKLFETLSLNNKVRLSEKISGDSSFSHSLALCQALAELSNTVVPPRAQYLRVIYAELERLANHFGDIGAIMLDTGFNFGGAHGARLREMILQLNERLTGSRFLRGVNSIGGVTKDITTREQEQLLAELPSLEKDFSEVIKVAAESTSLFNRLKGTGTLTAEIAMDRGAVGVAAKATGRLIDARVDFPYAAYDVLKLDKVATEQTGDVLARFRVRIKEVHAAFTLIRQALNKLPAGPCSGVGTKTVFRHNAVAVSVVEGWRGEIVYFVVTDAQGNISRIAPRDPSFMNWSVLENAGFGNVVPDFPLINKSFNLSYSGNDV